MFSTPELPLKRASTPHAHYTYNCSAAIPYMKKMYDNFPHELMIVLLSHRIYLKSHTHTRPPADKNSHNTEI